MYKLGKLPFEPNPKDFKLKEVSIALPPTPKVPFGYGTIFNDWGMLGNDDYGDCVFAGRDHETMLFNKLAKHQVAFTRENALSDYSAVTGFDPNDPNTDQGTYPRDAFDYSRTTGLVDVNGQRHKIDAFVQIPPGDFNLMLACVYTFGAVGIGFEFPNSAMAQFNNNQVWDVVSGARIEGGHYVPIVGTTDPANKATCITWGKRQQMTKAFYQKYNDESWVPLTKEALLPATNVRHIDWNTLQSQLDSL
jgi:hypothetical protein